MSIKKVVFIFVGLLFLISLYVGYNSYDNTTRVDIDNATIAFTINSEKLVEAFIEDEKEANTIYKGKVVAIEGVIKEVTFFNNRNTILLKGEHKNSSVICDMQFEELENIKNLERGQKIKIKGICKGFLKDVILLNCMLINTEKQ